MTVRPDFDRVARTAIPTPHGATVAIGAATRRQQRQLADRIEQIAAEAWADGHSAACAGRPAGANPHSTSP